MQSVLSMYMWASLPSNVRNKIRTTFNIPRSSHVVVNDGRIETDGTTPEDFKHLTVDKMQKYLASDSTDFHRLFDLTVQKIAEELQPKSVPVEIPKKKGRPAKQNAHEQK